MATFVDLQQIAKTETRLGANTVARGTIRFNRSLRIGGRFDGTIDASGFLYVMDGAEVTADVVADVIVVGGIVRGNIGARSRVEILPTGRVFGNIKTTRLRIADGVVFEGKCEMVKSGEQIDIFSAPVEELKRSVTRAG